MENSQAVPSPRGLSEMQQEDKVVLIVLGFVKGAGYVMIKNILASYRLR